MNQGRIWTVVPPAVGLPLIIGGAAVTALVVHFAVLTHTTWFSAYWQGGSKAKVAETDVAPATASLTQKATPAFVINVAPVEATAGSAATSFVVTVTPNVASDKSVAMAAPDTKQ
jgi:light-harvesting protein B-800-850 alpha chain